MPRRFWSTRIGTVLGPLEALLGGFALGGAWCSWRAERPWVPLLAQRALRAERQRERDRLAERVKALEQRAAPPPGDPH